MGLFSRLTASFHAKSRHLGSIDVWASDYPDKGCEEIRTAVEGVMQKNALLTEQAKSHLAMLEKYLPGLDAAAREAVTGGREQLAVVALYRKLLILRQMDQLQHDLKSMDASLKPLRDMPATLEQKSQAFKAERENCHAWYPLEEAEARVREAYSGLEEELEAIRYAVGRSEECTSRTEQHLQDAGTVAQRSREISDSAGIPDQDRAEVTRQLEAIRAEVNQR